MVSFSGCGLSHKGKPLEHNTLRAPEQRSWANFGTLCSRWGVALVQQNRCSKACLKDLRQVVMHEAQAFARLPVCRAERHCVTR
jgi:hypothetical protein